MLHSGVVFANALMHSGTTLDLFLRQNMDWLARATNWAKFSATASLGVIHKGHIKNALALLGPYLPGSGPSSSPFSEGGSTLCVYCLACSVCGWVYVTDRITVSGDPTPTLTLSLSLLTHRLVCAWSDPRQPRR